MAAITLDIGGNTRRLDRDIQKTVNKVYNINLKTKGDQPLGRITGQVNEFNKSLDASNARVIAFGASAGIIFGVERAFTALLTSVVEVQKSLQDINVILNVSSKELQKFGGELFNIAKNTGQTFQAVAEAATEFSRQGLGLEETLKRTSEALILSRLSGLDTVKSVEALTAAVNSFASQAVSATEVVNKFATVDAAFAVSSADLADAVARVGSSAAQSGVSLNELIAIVTSAQQTTARGGAVIGNSFKTIFTRLQRTKVVSLLESLGVETVGAGGQVKSTIQLLQDLGTVYDTLGAQQQAYVAEQVGGVFQINILKAALADLGKEYSIYNNALNVSASATDQAVRRNEELNKTYAAQLNALQENARQLAAVGGERLFGPSIDRLVGGTNQLLSGFNESDAQGFGVTLGRGILDGLGQFIAGPGLVLIGGVLLKLFKDLANFATGSVKQLLGLNTASAQQRDLQASISQILSKNPQLIDLALQGQKGLNTVANQLLTSLQQQTVELQKQAALASQLSKAFIGAGVRISGGIPVAPTPGRPGKAAGYIPNFASPQNKIAETIGAYQAGYEPGRIFNKRLYDGQGGSFLATVNSAESFDTVVGPNGNKGTFVTPPNGFAAKGFVPNFAKSIKTDDSSKIFGAGRVFENAVGLAAGLQKEYFEDNFILDYEPNVWAGKQDIKKILGINQRTNYGDAKLSAQGNNLTSYLSKVIRYDSGLRGVQKVGNIKDFNQKFGLRKKIDISKRGPNNINLSQPGGGAVIIPGNKKGDGSKDRTVNIKARLSELKKVNSSIANVFANPNNKYGIDPKSKSDPIFSLKNVLIDTTEVLRSGTFGAQGKEERERKARNIASRFTSKSFASGFIPNFAQTPTQSNKVVELGDTTTNPLFRGKVSSLIYPQVSENKSKAQGETTYLGKKYRGLVSIAGINKKALKGEIPDLEANLDQLLLREANEFGRAIGGTEFLQSASELPNIGAAKGAVGVSFEGGLLTLLKRDVQKSAQNARIDFTQDRINSKFKSLFHGAPGTYEAKYSPSLTGEVLQKMLRGAGVGEVKRVKSGPGAGASMKQREAVLASINKDVAEGRITQPRRGNALEAEVRRRLPLMFPGSVKGAAAGYIPNFAAPLVRAVDDKELRMMLSKFGKGFSFQGKSSEQSALEFFGGSGTYMWDALSRPGEQMSDRQAYKQNIGRAKNWSTARKQSSWLVRYNRSKLKDSELLPDMETGGASVYGLPLSKDQIVWPIKQANGAGRIFEKDIPAFLSGQVNDAIKREREAGIPKNKIYLAQEKALTKTNPMGLGVFNKLQEPNAATRKTAMRSKGFASGYIPNFAIEDPDMQAADLGSSIGAVVAQLGFLAFGLQGAGEQYKQSLAELTKSNVNTAKINSKNLRESTSRRLLVGNTAAAQGGARIRPDGSRGRDFSNYTGGKTGKEFGDLRRASRSPLSQQRRDEAARELRAARAAERTAARGTGGQKFAAAGKAGGFGLALAGPILGETIKNAFGQETPGARQAGTVAGAAGEIAGFAGTGAIFGPVGAAVGTVVGSLLTIPKIVGAFASDFPELSNAAKKAGEELTKFSDSGAKLLTSFETLQKGLEDPGTSQEVINKASEEYAKILSGLSAEDQKRLSAAAKTGKLETEYAKILAEKTAELQSREAAASLGQATGDVESRNFMRNAASYLNYSPIVGGASAISQSLGGPGLQDYIDYYLPSLTGVGTESDKTNQAVFAQSLTQGKSGGDALKALEKAGGTGVVKQLNQIQTGDVGALEALLNKVIPEQEGKADIVAQFIAQANNNAQDFQNVVGSLGQSFLKTMETAKGAKTAADEMLAAQEAEAKKKKTAVEATNKIIENLERNIRVAQFAAESERALARSREKFARQELFADRFTRKTETAGAIVGTDAPLAQAFGLREEIATIAQSQIESIENIKFSFVDTINSSINDAFKDATGATISGARQDGTSKDVTKTNDQLSSQAFQQTRAFKEVQSVLNQYLKSSGTVNTEALLAQIDQKLADAKVNDATRLKIEQQLKEESSKVNGEIKLLKQESVQNFKKLAKEQLQRILIQKIGQAQAFGGGIDEFLNPREAGEGAFDKVTESVKAFDQFEGQQADFRFDYRQGTNDFRYQYGAAQRARQEMAPEFGREALKLIGNLQNITGYTPDPQGKAFQAGVTGLEEFLRRRVTELQTLAKDPGTGQLERDEINAALSTIPELGGLKTIATLQVARQTGALDETQYEAITKKYQDPVLQALRERAIQVGGTEGAALLEEVKKLAKDRITTEGAEPTVEAINTTNSILNDILTSPGINGQRSNDVSDVGAIADKLLKNAQSPTINPQLIGQATPVTPTTTTAAAPTTPPISQIPAIIDFTPVVSAVAIGNSFLSSIADSILDIKQIQDIDKDYGNYDTRSREKEALSKIQSKNENFTSKIPATTGTVAGIGGEVLVQSINTLVEALRQQPAQNNSAQSQGVTQPNIQTTTNAPVTLVVNAESSTDIATAVGEAVQNAIPTIIDKVKVALGQKVPPKAGG
jgi:TP901 family phage tail tape measure protein